MSDEQALVRSEGQAVAIQEPTNLLTAIMTLAKDLDVEKLERLMAMQERLESRQRETEFHAAMARLQSKLPQVIKSGQGKNSKFAKLEDIDVIIRPLLAEEGFSFSFDEEDHSDKTVTFLAKLSHQQGHSETKRLTVPIDVSATNRDGKSIRPAIHDSGSTVSYARRYLIKMHLNLIERNEDNDGQGPAPALTNDQVLDLKAQLESVAANVKIFLEYMGVEKLEDILQRDLKKAYELIERKRRQNQK